jgi:membrane protein implicated in regulation of membrane protease activity
LSAHSTDSSWTRALLWLGVIAPLVVAAVQAATGHWSEATWLLLLLGVVNAASWAAGVHGEKHPGRLSRLHLR